MKKILATLAMSVLLIGTATASERNARPAEPASTRYYVGVTAGGAVDTSGNYNDLLNNSTPSLGVVGGRQITNNLAVEATYDYFLERNGVGSGQSVFVNGVAGYRIPNTMFTPYVLAGTGYGFDSLGDRTLYNVGAGVRADVTRSLSLDVRYRHMNNWDNDNRMNVVTGGINFRF